MEMGNNDSKYRNKNYARIVNIKILCRKKAA